VMCTQPPHVDHNFLRITGGNFIEWHPSSVNIFYGHWLINLSSRANANKKVPVYCFLHIWKVCSIDRTK